VVHFSLRSTRNPYRIIVPHHNLDPCVLNRNPKLQWDVHITGNSKRFRDINLWNRLLLPLMFTIMLFNALVQPVVLFGSQTWKMTERDNKKIDLHIQSVSGLQASGIFAPWSEGSQWEPSLPETKGPRNFHSREQMFRSRERMFPGTFVPDIVTSLSDHGKGCWRCSESKSKKI